VSYGHDQGKVRDTDPVTNPGQLFSVTSAAEACRVSRKTITRRLDQLKDGGAYKDAAGSWVIPLGALLHAGLTPGTPTPPDAVPQSQGLGPGHVDVGQAQRDTDRETQARLADLQRRAEVAEALAVERAEQITDLRRTLAMLTAGKSDTPAPPVPAPSVSQDVPQQSAGRRGPIERLAGRFGL
jgi:hypothetical protein